VTHAGSVIEVRDVLVDTGAASSVLNADLAADAGDAGIFAGHADKLRVLRGVGGGEYVFVRQIARVAVDGHGLDHFDLEIGEMDYGFDLGGILGMDFLRASGAIIDLQNLTLTFAARTLAV